MHWSLDQVRDLDVDEFDQLIDWIKERGNRQSGDEGSIDLDKVIDDRKRERASGE